MEKRTATFQERLKEAITKKGITQMELSRLTGISKSLICRYLRGDCEAGNIKLSLLANALHVSPVWLMGFNIDCNNTKENNDLIDQAVELLKSQDDETLEKILSMIKLMIK